MFADFHDIERIGPADLPHGLAPGNDYHVTTMELPHSTDREATLKLAQDLLLAKGLVQRDDMIVITWGEPMGQAGGTNALNIVKVGEH